MRYTFLPILGAAVCLGTACSTTARFESRSYALQNAAVETVLIGKVAGEEFDRLGSRGSDAVLARGGQLQMVELVDDVAVVTTTSRGHSAIKEALAASRSDIDAVEPGT